MTATEGNYMSADDGSDSSMAQIALLCNVYFRLYYIMIQNCHPSDVGSKIATILEP